MIIALLFVLVSGCSMFTNGDGKLKWFDTQEEAINNGLKEERILKSDILGQLKSNGEVFVFYTTDVPEGSAVGVASISRNNGKFAWYRPNASVLVKYDKTDKNKAPNLSFDIKTRSEKKFKGYLGMTKLKSFTLETDNGEVITPKINKKSQIYFYIEPN